MGGQTGVRPGSNRGQTGVRPRFGVQSPQKSGLPHEPSCGRDEDFLSIDARLSRTFQLKHGELDAWLEVTNLTNRSNPCCVEYSVLDGPPPVLFKDEDNWLPILPSVGVLWRY